MRLTRMSTCQHIAFPVLDTDDT